MTSKSTLLILFHPFKGRSYSYPNSTNKTLNKIIKHVLHLMENMTFEKREEEGFFKKLFCKGIMRSFRGKYILIFPPPQIKKRFPLKTIIYQSLVTNPKIDFLRKILPLAHHYANPLNYDFVSVV